MRRRPIRALPILLAMALVLQAACGKRADPLAPYVKTPQPPTGLEVAQIGEEVEIRIIAPRVTTENRPLPVFELEWLQGPPTGDFAKGAIPLVREDVAPGEARVKRFPRPAGDVRFTARAINGKARSAQAPLLLYKPAPIPLAPTALQLTNTPTGVELRWTNPQGAEPWPTPPPSPSPTASPTPAGSPPPLPPPTAMPVPQDAKDKAPTATPAAGSKPGASPSPSPTPSPTPPTGIRIFRTDGSPRLAREPLQASTWLDSSPKPGEKPCYALRYATSFKPLVESVQTEPACVEVKDIVPPEPPGRLVADLGTTFVELSWTASPSTDVAFYRIYRAFEGAPRTLAIETQGLVLRMRDPNLAPGTRLYDVVAVDKSGNESTPTAPLRLIVP